MRALTAFPIGVFLAGGLMSSMEASSLTGLVIFGDSLSDAGNTAITTTAALGGEAGGLLAGLPQTELPYAPFYQNGIFTDGSLTSPSSAVQGLWVQQLAPKLGLPVPAPSLAGGSDYAFAGAETGSGIAYQGLVQNMGLQLTDYCGACTSVSPNNLYVFWGGSDDILDNPTNPVAAADTAAANIMGYINTLANAGGKEFLWLNLPPLGNIPLVASQGPTAQLIANDASMAFNQAWATDIGLLDAGHPGITMVGMNTYALFNAIANDPSAYGFTNITSPAANFMNGNQNVNPDQYLFWDAEHPTTTGHTALANVAEADLAAAPEPSTVALAGIGVGALLLWRLRRSAV